MTAVMAYGPLGLATCGIGFGGILGAVSWHVVAMYAPALGLAPIVRRFGPVPLALVGLALVALAGFGALVIKDPAAIVAALIAVGIGWSLATTAAVIALHEGVPSRLMLAGHDATVLAAAVAGALAAGRIGV